MKSFKGLFLTGIVLFFLLSTCDKGPETITYLEESDHFILHGSSMVTSREEMETILEKSESLFPKIAAFLGDMHEPESKIQLWLEGDMINQGSYVDFDGVHLYRYNMADGGYLAVLAHELAHAFIAPWFIEMEAWDWFTYRFFDEGIAEYVAQHVDSLKQGFPFYGYPEHVVAGYLVVSNAHIPCELLRTNHAYYNESCNLQAYPQRTSWIRHLDELFGREVLFSVVFPDEEPTSEVVESLTGLSLSELDALWETWITGKYNSIEGAEDLAEAFVNRTSWYTLCENSR